tara:strand:- start:922 stop:1845 length:924 start_codon:yes stop_codon:yes gene_type:complete
MASLLSSKELVSVLEKHIPTCNDLVVISAYVSMPAVRWINHLTAKSSPNITIVGRFSPHDFISGASDFGCLKECLNIGIVMKALPNLHAKIYQIDTNKIFSGSANLTGKGLGLISAYNIEAASEIHPTESNLKFIESVVSNATAIDNELLKRMETFLEAFDINATTELPNIWPEDFFELSAQLFVTDFPLSRVNEKSPEYAINPSLPFAILEQTKLTETEKAYHFKKTKVYRWLIDILSSRGEAIRFGELTGLIHDKLADDPGPYRREVKALQANLYNYIKLYAEDEIELFIPGKRSELLRLRRKGK